MKKKWRFALVLILYLLLPFSCFESRWHSPCAASLSLKLFLGKKSGNIIFLWVHLMTDKVKDLSLPELLLPLTAFFFFFFLLVFCQNIESLCWSPGIHDLGWGSLGVQKLNWYKFLTFSLFICGSGADFRSYSTLEDFRSVAYTILAMYLIDLVSCSVMSDWEPVDCSLPGSPVNVFLQERILEWLAIPFSRGSSLPKNWTHVSWTAGRFFTVWVTMLFFSCILSLYFPKSHYYSVPSPWGCIIGFAFVFTSMKFHRGLVLLLLLLILI